MSNTEDNKSNKGRNIAIGSGIIASSVLVPIVVALIENGTVDRLINRIFPESTPTQTTRSPEPPSQPTPEPPSQSVVLKEIIFLEENGIKEVCVNLPDSTVPVEFHAWRSDGSGIDLPMNTTSDSSCMYWINLPPGAEGGTLKVDDQWASVGDFLVRAESGCSEAVTINEGIIAASTSPNSSLLGTRDSINGDSAKWGWACK